MLEVQARLLLRQLELAGERRVVLPEQVRAADGLEHACEARPLSPRELHHVALEHEEVPGLGRSR